MGEEPTFEEFINEKIKEDPDLAEQNLALLSMYQKGLIQVSYNHKICDFDIKASAMGKQWYYTNLAGVFVPAEA